MNIYMLYSRLTIEEKMGLLELIAEDDKLNIKVEYDDIRVCDWLDNYILEENIFISVRLFNCLRFGSRHEWKIRDNGGFLNNIQKVDIMSIRNAGQKCWEEFEKLRNTYNETIKK